MRDAQPHSERFGSARYRGALLLAPLLFVALSTSATAREADEFPRRTADIVAWLGVPAHAEVVEEAVALASRADPEAQRRLATALGRSGGVAALEGLVALARTSDDDVKSAVLAAATTVGLRHAELAGVARAALQSRTLSTRLMAARALGCLGSGADVPSLLALTAPSVDTHLRDAAHTAISELAGRVVPRAGVRRAEWWAQVQREAEQAVPQALEALAEGEGDQEHARWQLRHFGWVEIADVRAALVDWVGGADSRRRTEACRLAGELRLADLAPALLRLRPFDRSVSFTSALGETFRRLGVRTD